MVTLSGRIRSYLRSNLLGLVAIFIALGGVAWGASTVRRNTVVSKSIKNGQVKRKDLGRSAVNSAKVADDSLTGADIANDSLTGADIAESSLDTNVLQARLSGVPCPDGQAVSSVAADGTASCGVTNGGVPGGAIASGDLAGSSYPNPAIAPGAVHGANIGCPTGTTPDQIVCVTPVSSSGAGWFTSAQDCEAEGLRLPTTAEAAFLSDDGYLGAHSVWGDTVYFDGTQIASDTFSSTNANAFDVPTVSSDRRVCVSPRPA